ncbi:hypothetical protein B0H17DRAFT_1245716 [Mycena rosella]|uniref:Secreted protein n=1 Tax=Mycena rosella TaxID=1033263 RepID=A0AAD7GM35_MYCRO|nr:hypothetical protein B0H17DRAFT_1245716 [Mycena rosella]
MFTSLLASLTAALLMAGAAHGAVTPQSSTWTLTMYGNENCLASSGAPPISGSASTECTPVTTTLESVKFTADGIVSGVLLNFYFNKCIGLPALVIPADLTGGKCVNVNPKFKNYQVVVPIV